MKPNDKRLNLKKKLIKKSTNNQKNKNQIEYEKQIKIYFCNFPMRREREEEIEEKKSIIATSSICH